MALSLLLLVENTGVLSCKTEQKKVFMLMGAQKNATTGEQS
ncbi:hypothetical protein [Izhakiella australiensis]|nr:hypothetical protein [Izhakiella australiensis]